MADPCDGWDDFWLDQFRHDPEFAATMEPFHKTATPPPPRWDNDEPVLFSFNAGQVRSIKTCLDHAADHNCYEAMRWLWDFLNKIVYPNVTAWTDKYGESE